MTAPRTAADALAWVGAIADPQQALAWDLAQWERVVRLARRLRLLARLAESLTAAGLLERVPPQPARHLHAEAQRSQWRTQTLRWAATRVGAALDAVDAPRLLLKGAAYVAQDLPIARGRLPSDLDILVPRDRLPAAQAALVDAGWREFALDDHDQRYYREWSHEVPPMHHAQHAMELDLHHAILPPMARVTVDTARLLERAQPSPWPGWLVLQPADQVLHSAAHLFHDSEARDRVRDIVDIDGLLRHFGADPAFWDQLTARATALRLGEPLALALHFACAWLATPVPADARARIAAIGPSAARRAWLHPLLATLLAPAEPDAGASTAQTLAAQVLLVRYHLARLPLALLVPHLLHKATARRRRAPAADAAPPAAVDVADG